ncbi:MAG TPA: hypothetical protein VGU27_08165 [Candidatus Eisenbacteria bacterium]|nr:hypothetical protein [Candidatus Eisenbacteria bacterium]
MNFPGTQFDERFLMHRLRSTSAAAVVGGAVALGLFLYHLWFDHAWRWELFAVALAMAVAKQGLMLWYRFTN